MKRFTAAIAMLLVAVPLTACTRTEAPAQPHADGRIDAGATLVTPESVDAVQLLACTTASEGELTAETAYQLNAFGIFAASQSDPGIVWRDGTGITSREEAAELGDHYQRAGSEAFTLTTDENIPLDEAWSDALSRVCKGDIAAISTAVNAT